MRSAEGERLERSHRARPEAARRERRDRSRERATLARRCKRRDGRAQRYGVSGSVRTVRLLLSIRLLFIRFGS